MKIKFINYVVNSLRLENFFISFYFGIYKSYIVKFYRFVLFKNFLCLKFTIGCVIRFLFKFRILSCLLEFDYNFSKLLIMFNV